MNTIGDPIPSITNSNVDNETDMVDDLPLDNRTLLSRVNNSVDINKPGKLERAPPPLDTKDTEI